MEMNREKGAELNGTIVQQHMKECDTTEGPLVRYLKRSNSVFLQATEKCEGNKYHGEVIPFLLNNNFFQNTVQNIALLFMPQWTRLILFTANPYYNNSERLFNLTLYQDSTSEDIQIENVVAR